MNDMELLREYASGGSESAFKEIVDRHVNLVYSAALRQVRDPTLAQDISQAVFLTLARKAGKLSSRTILSGWLYRTTQFAASRALRSELRRQHREQEAIQMQTAAPDRFWEQIAPHLDEAMAELGDTDRNAVVLRYFENKDLRAVGQALGVSDDAAQKRLSRAVEKLRRFFSKRQITVTSAVVAAAISTHAVAAAPSQLGASIFAVGCGQAVVSPAIYEISKGILQRLFWPKIAQGTLAVLCAVAAAWLTVQNFPLGNSGDDAGDGFGGNNLSAPKRKIVRKVNPGQTQETILNPMPYPVAQPGTPLVVVATSPNQARPIATNSQPLAAQKAIIPKAPAIKPSVISPKSVASIPLPRPQSPDSTVIATNGLPEVPIDNSPASTSSHQSQQSGGNIRVIGVRKAKR